MHGASTCLFGLGFSGSNWGGNTSHIPEAGPNRPLRLPCCLFRWWINPQDLMVLVQSLNGLLSSCNGEDTN